MQFSQQAILRLWCASFVAGLLLALFYDLLYATRLWLIPIDKRYTVVAIQNRVLQSKKETSPNKKPKFFFVALLCQDVFFCFVGALASILILYWLNSGVFRATTLLSIAFGFWIWHMSFSKIVRAAFQWFVYGIEVALNALLIPIKCLLIAIAKRCKEYLQKKQQKRLHKRRQEYTKLELQSINRAAMRLLPMDDKPIRKGERRAKQHKKAI